MCALKKCSDKFNSDFKVNLCIILLTKNNICRLDSQRQIFIIIQCTAEFN